MTIAPTSVHGLSILAVAASMTCLAAPARAQDEQAVAVAGQAEQICSLGQPSQAAAGALTNFDTPSGAVFGITSLADPVTLSTQAASITLSVDATCNGVHRVAIASDNNGLWRQGAASPASGFGSAAPYRVTLAWAEQEQVLTAEASSRQSVEEQMLVGRPSTGEMLIEFQIDAGATNVGPGAPLLAGEYSDVLRVTVEFAVMSARSLLALGALAALAAGPAAAQSDPGTATVQATIRGDAPAGCRLSTPTAPTADNAEVGALAPGSADIALSQLIGEDGASLGATVVLVLPAICNQAHTLNLASLHGGLLGDNPVPGGGAFRSNLPYAVTIAWAGAQQSFQSQDGIASFALGEAAAGPVTVTIQVPSGGQPLAAGAYSDELVLELGVAG